MCLACGSPGVQGDWTLAGFPADGNLTLPYADRRLSDLTSLLERYGVTVRRGAFRAGFFITGSAGPEAHVASIDALWPVVQALTGCVIDPLDPGFLAWADA